MALLILAAIIFLFVNPNFRAIRTMRKEIRELEKRVEELREENTRLNEELTALKHDPAYIEALARKKLGLIKPGEIEYRFIEKEAEER